MRIYNNTSILISAPSGSPLNVRLMDIDPSTLRVTYDRVAEQFRNGLETGYRIKYVRADTINDSQEIEVSNGTALNVTIAGLVAFTNYSVQVAAFNDVGDGPLSNPMFSLSGQDSEYL